LVSQGLCPLRKRGGGEGPRKTEEGGVGRKPSMVLQPVEGKGIHSDTSGEEGIKAVEKAKKERTEGRTRP